MDVVNQVKRNLESFFSPVASQVGKTASTITDLFAPKSSGYISPIQDIDDFHKTKSTQRVIPPQGWPGSQPAQQAPQRAVQGARTMQPVSDLERNIQAGYNRYSNPQVPVATLSAQLAEAGSQLPDPYLPAVLALMETQGLRQARTPNNIFNVGPDFDYPDPETAILGGGPRNQMGLIGLLTKSGLYDDYMQSGDLTDFFDTYTPPGEEYGNPEMEQLLERYYSIRDLFEPQLAMGQ